MRLPSLTAAARVWSIGCAAALLVALAAMPAVADSTTVTDPAGNKPNAYMDITTVKYNNGQHRIEVIVHGVDLQKRSTYLGIDIKPADKSGVTYSVATYGNLGKPGYHKTLVKYDGAATSKLHCGSTMTWKPKLDYVDVVIPQKCLQGHNGTVRMSAFLTTSYSEGGHPDRAGHVLLDRG